MSAGAHWPHVQSVATSLLTAVLIAGTTPKPVPTECLRGVPSDPGAEPDIVVNFAVSTARSTLEQLAELGLVEADTHYAVPPVIIQCIAALRVDAFGNEFGNDDDELGNDSDAYDDLDRNSDDVDPAPQTSVTFRASRATAKPQLAGKPEVTVPSSNVVPLQPRKRPSLPERKPSGSRSLCWGPSRPSGGVLN